jgi:protein required for attachment to host cells
VTSKDELAEMQGAALVVVADSSRSRVFQADNPTAPLREREDLLNPEARLLEGELSADAGGRIGRQVREGGHSAFGGGTVKWHRAEEFAAAVSRRVEQALHQTGSQRLYLLAEPEFLGLLRQRMPSSLRQRISFALSRSLTRESASRIRAVLPSRL